MDPGALREVVVIEAAHEAQNEVGEMVITWEPWRRVRASVANVGFYQSLRAQQMSADVTHIITIHYCDGLVGSMRLRWESRDNRLLYISSITEQGIRQWHEITAEERANNA